jgi:hypothetical protein
MINFAMTALLVVGLTMLTGFKGLGSLDFFKGEAVVAQTISPQEVWRQVYEQLPDFPLENQYVNIKTGKVDSQNTLVSRLIRYHVYVKGRPVIYRLDWKVTLADYLGINEGMIETLYPARDVLQANPMEGDRAVISSLNRKQRDTLVQALVTAFNPKPSPQPTVQPSTGSQPSINPAQPLRARPGDAQLLLP